MSNKEAHALISMTKGKNSQLLSVSYMVLDIPYLPLCEYVMLLD